MLNKKQHKNERDIFCPECGKVAEEMELATGVCSECGCVIADEPE